MAGFSTRVTEVERQSEVCDVVVEERESVEEAKDDSSVGKAVSDITIFVVVVATAAVVVAVVPLASEGFARDDSDSTRDSRVILDKLEPSREESKAGEPPDNGTTPSTSPASGPDRRVETLVGTSDVGNFAALILPPFLSSSSSVVSSSVAVKSIERTGCSG